MRRDVQVSGFEIEEFLNGICVHLIFKRKDAKYRWC